MTVTTSIADPPPGLPPAPAEVPTTPTGVPRVDPEHIGLEHAAEVVCEALTEFCDLLAGHADDVNRDDAAALAGGAVVFSGQVRSLVMQMRWQRTSTARFRGHAVRVGTRPHPPCTRRRASDGAICGNDEQATCTATHLADHADHLDFGAAS